MEQTIWRCSTCRREYGSPPPPTCGACLSALYPLPIGWHGHRLSAAPRKPQVVSAMDLRRRRYARRKAGPVMRRITGVDRVPEVLTACVYGLPGAGKSTLLARLLEDGTWQRPLLAASEEGLGVGLADRLARLEATKITLTDATSYPELASVLADDEADYDVVALDSITSSGITLSELQVLRQQHSVSIVAIVQSTKGGTFSGSQALKHDSDLFLRVESMTQGEVEKSWFGPCGPVQLTDEEVTYAQGE